MISKKMTAAINEQINAELYSAYMYMAMSSHAQHKGLNGVANWFFVQAQEETTHALKFFHYVQEQGEHAVLKAIEQPPATYASLKAMVQATLKHEKAVTARINKLVDAARKEKDHATEIFLQWFVSEQVEEEASVSDVLARLDLIGEKGPGAFMLDKELGARTFTPPAASGD
jgi:ferritin